jgi:hypothetical protein
LRYAPADAWKAIRAAATTAATTSSCTKPSRPSAYATGIVMSAPNRTTSIAIITGRLRRTSAHGPSGNAISAPSAGPTAASNDT